MDIEKAIEELLMQLLLVDWWEKQDGDLGIL
jgi:hypothetical protein